MMQPEHSPAPEPPIHVTLHLVSRASWPDRERPVPAARRLAQLLKRLGRGWYGFEVVSFEVPNDGK